MPEGIPTRVNENTKKGFQNLLFYSIVSPTTLCLRRSSYYNKRAIEGRNNLYRSIAAAIFLIAAMVYTRHIFSSFVFWIVILVLTASIVYMVLRLVKKYYLFSAPAPPEEDDEPADPQAP